LREKVGTLHGITPNPGEELRGRRRTRSGTPSKNRKKKKAKKGK